MLKAEAAKHLGISERTLGYWQKELGFPDRSDGYNIPAVIEWRDSLQLKGSEEHDDLKATRLRYEKHRVDLAAIEVEKKRHEWEAQKGNYLERDVYELAIKELLTILRDRIVRIPKELCSFVSDKKIQKKLTTEGDHYVRSAMDELAKDISHLREEGEID